jgi:hypothetical protein
LKNSIVTPCIFDIPSVRYRLHRGTKSASQIALGLRPASFTLSIHGAMPQTFSPHA